jgi:two-component system chemotaxis response regulator CheB
MPNHRNLVVMGASAGGVEVLLRIIAGLPEDFPAAVCIVLHTSPTSPSILPELLDRAGPLPAATAKNGDTLRNGHVYVAPPDQHLLIKDSRIHLTRGPKENGFRPAVDTLFRSAAHARGPALIGVVLSGSLDDGTIGLDEIHRAGGLTIVQDPQEAAFPSMPTSAIRNVEINHIAPVNEIPALLTQLVNEPLRKGSPMTSAKKSRPDVSEDGTSGFLTGELPGPPSPFTCPECGGSLWELANDGKLTYRCHVGHGFTPDSLLDSQTKALEAALWTALRTLEESAAFNRRVAGRINAAVSEKVVASYLQKASEAERHAAVLRQILTRPAKAAGGVITNRPTNPVLKRPAHHHPTNGDGANGTAPPSAPSKKSRSAKSSHPAKAAFARPRPKPAR